MRRITATVGLALKHLTAEADRRERAIADRLEGLGTALVDLHDDRVMERAWS